MNKKNIEGIHFSILYTNWFVTCTMIRNMWNSLYWPTDLFKSNVNNFFTLKSGPLKLTKNWSFTKHYNYINVKVCISSLYLIQEFLSVCLIPYMCIYILCVIGQFTGCLHFKCKVDKKNTVMFSLCR